MYMNQKTVIELPVEEYNSIQAKLDKILLATENGKKSFLPEKLTRKEFMAEAKISHNKMNKLLRSGKLKYNRIGPKIISISADELKKYIGGEIS